MFRTHYNSNSKIWSGLKVPSIFNPKVNLGHTILTVLKKTPNMVTQVCHDTGTEVTCSEMMKRTVKMIEVLKTSGLKTGDIVCMMARNSEFLAPVIFACFYLNLPINFWSPVFNEDDILYFYKMTKPKLIICDFDFVGKIKNSLKNSQKPPLWTFLQKVGNLGFVEDLIAKTSFNENLRLSTYENTNKIPALWLCTSGTTGLPKLVSLTHEQILTQMVPYWEMVGNEEDVIFSFCNCYWTTAIRMLVVGTLYCSRRIITKVLDDADLLIDIINQHKVSTVFSVPDVMYKMLTSPKLKEFPSIRNFTLGGSKSITKYTELMSRYFPNGEILCGYGITENGGSMISIGEGRFENVGQLFQNMKLKIYDEDQNLLGPNQIGEVAFKGPVPVMGYLNNPEQTKKMKDSDGFVFSGDIGYFDDLGNLTLIDRKKDIMKCDWHQVSPSEIESVINEIEFVASSCVVGVSDGIVDDIICAFVIRKDERLTENDVINYVNSRVADYKKIKGPTIFVREYPRTPSGKILKRELRKIAEIKLKELTFLINNMPHFNSLKHPVIMKLPNQIYL